MTLAPFVTMINDLGAKIITGLKRSICLHASTPNKTQAGVCSVESEGLVVKKMA